MRIFKSAKKTILSAFILLIILPLMCHMALLLAHSAAEKAALDTRNRTLHPAANYYLSHFGGRYYAFDVIHYLERCGGDACSGDSGHGKAFLALYAKYPDMQNKYVASLVAGILDPGTRPRGRSALVALLESVTGESFGDAGAVNDTDNIRPSTNPADESAAAAGAVAGWWEHRLLERAFANSNAITQP